MLSADFFGAIVRRAVDRRVRSQATSFRRLVVYCILVASCLILLAVSFGGKFGAPQQLTLETLGPVQKFFTRVSMSLTRVKDNYIDLVNVRETNKLLRVEIARQNEIIGRYREGYTRYIQLQKQLEFKKSIEPPHTVSARIVGKDPSFWFKTIIVDRGLSDGVTEGMVALSSEGVVGQVVHSSDNYSKILLANAPSSAIDAKVQKSGVRGILKGSGEKGYTLHYVLKNVDVEVGDDIVTTGVSGVFKIGIPLGKVSAVRKKRRGMFLEIEVKPSVDFQRLQMVIISVSEKQYIDQEMLNQ